jgi:hypothetical protein
MTLVAEYQYFSPVIFYLKLGAFSNCVFDSYENFQKSTFRNRCTLLGPNGVISLTVPLVGGREQKQRMKDVRIDHRENWRSRHWKTITSCYNRSPWLDHFRTDLEALYSKKMDYLVDWDFACHSWVCDKLSISVSSGSAGEYLEKYENSEYVDGRGDLEPATINTRYPDAIRYPQVFGERHGFVPNLSILDYLFCSGNRLPV